MDKHLKATVFIPVYNGENDHLEETLTALYQQETDFSWDVIITDSESSDNSVAIIERFAEQYGNLQLVKLPKKSILMVVHAKKQLNGQKVILSFI